jgi:hypothetical protein
MSVTPIWDSAGHPRFVVTGKPSEGYQVWMVHQAPCGTWDRKYEAVKHCWELIKREAAER